MWRSWASSPSKTFFTACLAVIAGTAAHAFCEQVLFAWDFSWAVTLAGAALTWAAALRDGAGGRAPWRRLGLVALGAFAVAFMRYDFALSASADFITPPSGTHHFTGTVLSADGLATALVMTGVAMDGVAVATSVKVISPLPTELLPGDRASWSGRPRAAAPADRGHGLVLLGKPGWLCDAGDLRLARAGEWSVARAAGAARAALRRRVAELMPQTEATLLLGLLTGEQSGLPPKVMQTFRDTGTAHVLAVSGYNITQVVSLALALFVAAALPHRRALLAAGLAVMAFTWFVGAGPSVVRAALMGAMGLVARRLGRRYDAPIGLAFTAALMLLANPFILRYDLGFRLSFAAVLGLMVFARPLAERLKWVRPKFAAEALSTTLAATLFTLPISLAEFGVLAYVGPLANVLVGPLVGALMIIGPVVLLAACVLPWAAPVLGLVAWLPLKLLVTAVALCALVRPLAVSFSALDEAVMYGVLAVWAWYWRPKPLEDELDI